MPCRIDIVSLPLLQLGKILKSPLLRVTENLRTYATLCSCISIIPIVQVLPASAITCATWHTHIDLDAFGPKKSLQSFARPTDLYAGISLMTLELASSPFWYQQNGDSSLLYNGAETEKFRWCCFNTAHILQLWLVLSESADVPRKPWQSWDLRTVQQVLYRYRVDSVIDLSQ